MITYRQAVERGLVGHRRSSNATEHDVSRDDLRKMAAKLAFDIERERFNHHLQSTSAAEVGYIEVERVSGPRHDLALATITAAAADLATSSPALQWCRRTRNGETPDFTSAPINGFADPKTNTIWLRHDLPIGRIMETVAHEVSHIAGKDELDAQLYAQPWRFTL